MSTTDRNPALWMLDKPAAVFSGASKKAVEFVFVETLVRRRSILQMVADHFLDISRRLPPIAGTTR